MTQRGSEGMRERGYARAWAQLGRLDMATSMHSLFAEPSSAEISRALIGLDEQAHTLLLCYRQGSIREL